METPPPQQPPQQPAPQPGPMAPQPGYMPIGPTIRFDVIGQAFNMVFADLATWAVAALSIFLVTGVVVAIFYFVLFAAVLAGGNFLLLILGDMLLVFLLIAVGYVMMANMYRMAIMALSGVRPSVNEMFKFGPNSSNVIVAALLVGLASAVGVLACGIGSIVVGGALMFTMPLVVDRGLAPMDAINLSWKTLQKDIVMAALFFFVIGFCAEIGAVACFVGVVVTLPVMPLAITMLYRDYLGFANAPAATPPVV